MLPITKFTASEKMLPGAIDHLALPLNTPHVQFSFPEIINHKISFEKVIYRL